VILLDENFPQDQRLLLLRFGFKVRQIGEEEGRAGMQDDEIIPLLVRKRNITFITHDRDFYGSELCHSAYCIIHLAVKADSLAEYARRVLCHKEFSPSKKRLGKVLAAGPAGINVFVKGSHRPVRIAWTE
jgi:hypothetical protein